MKARLQKHLAHKQKEKKYCKHVIITLDEVTKEQCWRGFQELSETLEDAKSISQFEIEPYK